MPFYFFFPLLLLTSTLCPLHCASTVHHHHRRILHQPFLPLDSLPPSQPPSPSTPSPPSSPRYPFTSSSSPSPPTSDNSPFFPTYPSPPPPPSPASFASFPANISSLTLPHSPSRSSSSRKLIPLSVTAGVFSALLLSSVAFFLYRRHRRWRHDLPEDTDTAAKVIPHSGGGQSNAETGGGRQRSTAPSSTSSEFLYLGTIVNTRGVEDRRNAGRGGSNGLDPRKLDSPELQPLPPLTRQGYRQNGDVGSTTDETEEEFYSPRGSLGTGSGSRRLFASAGANLGDSRRRSESSRSSSSSSTSCSPARSHSISLSPPVSLSPRRSQPKSPQQAELQHVHYAIPLPDESKTPLLLSSQSTSPERDSPGRKFSRSSSAVSDRNPRPHSPSLSPLSWSPDRGLERNPDVSLRMWNISDSNVQSLHSSPSPGRASLKSSSSQTPQSRVPSLLSQSPERVVEANEASPRISSASEQSQSERLSLPFYSGSPVRVSGSPAPSSSLSPGRVPGVKLDQQQEPVSVAAAPSPPPPPTPPPASVVAVAAPPAPWMGAAPPPPPPPPTLHKLQESPVPLTPTDQSISRPLPLTPLFKPFEPQNTVEVSPVELPLSSEMVDKVIDETPKPKLKPLHWDKVRASSDREMVWDHLRSSSFTLNEEMIETLFVVNTPSLKPKDTTPRSVLPYPNQENRVLDPKKSQNIAILLRALNVTIEEVCEALLEGNAEMLGSELLESLQKMAPTKEEERKLKDFRDDSPVKLGPAEKFLKAVLGVPFAFKRVDAMLYIANFESEVDYLKKCFATLEAACEELRNSRMFLKLLEAVLKTGNRMNVGTNRGDARAFKLDTLLKLVDVKGADGKTTLLHFVVQEIIRSEGARLSGVTQQAPSNPNVSEDAKCRKLGLQVVSGLTSELANVKKAAAMDSDVLSGDVSKLSVGIGYIGEIVRLVESSTGSDSSTTKFSDPMNRFIKMAEEEIIRIQAQESVAMSLVKEITEYFHGDSAKEEAHPFRIFMVVRDFLAILDRVCKEVGSINERTIISSAHRFPVPVNPLLPVPVNPMLPQVLPPFQGKKRYNSSDDESSSS